MASNGTSQATTQTEITGLPKRATSLNRVILVGSLVATPELHTASSGQHVTTVRVATNDRQQPEFNDVVLWGQLADFAAKYLTKGAPRLRRGSAAVPHLDRRRRKQAPQRRDRRRSLPSAVGPGDRRICGVTPGGAGGATNPRPAQGLTGATAGSRWTG